MSVKVIALVWNFPNVKGGEKLVLLALADEANDLGGSCFPGLDRVARKTGMSVRQVQRVIRALEKKCVVETSLGTSPYGTNEYSMRRFVAEEGKRQAMREMSTGVKMSPTAETPPRHNVTPPGDIMTGGGDVSGTGGVTFADPKCHPTRKDPLVTREKEEDALPPPLPAAVEEKQPNVTAEPAHLTPLAPETVQAREILSSMPKDFRTAWEQWVEHRNAMDGVRPMTPSNKTSVLFTCQKAGVAWAISVIRFSINKNASNLIWDKPLHEIPKAFRYNPDARPVNGTGEQPPGLKEWLRDKFEKADAETPWARLPPEVNYQFRSEHPELKFSGARHQFYEGKADAA